MRIYCSCCARQIIQNSGQSSERTAPGLGAKADIGNQAICGDCAKDLDDNGMFPEEQAFL